MTVTVSYVQNKIYSQKFSSKQHHLLCSLFTACPGGVDKPCNDHGSCEVCVIFHVLDCASVSSLLRVLVGEMVKERVNAIRDTPEMCVMNVQLVITMNLIFV